MNHFGSSRCEHSTATEEKKRVRAYVNDQSYAEGVERISIDSGALVMEMEDKTLLLIAPGNWRTAHTEFITAENTLPISG